MIVEGEMTSDCGNVARRCPERRSHGSGNWMGSGQLSAFEMYFGGLELDTARNSDNPVTMAQLMAEAQKSD
jgi:hypothetical protein